MKPFVPAMSELKQNLPIANYQKRIQQSTINLIIF